MVNIRLHGSLGKEFKSSYDLDVKSVSEAIHAINILNNGRFYKFLNKSPYAKYKIIVNGKQFKHNGELAVLNNQSINAAAKSELCVKRKIQSIDIVPVIELGDEGVLGVVLGALLIVVGVVLVATGVGGALGAALIVGGLGILAAGVMNLLAKPPSFEDFREIGDAGKRASYLFNGPQNTIGEGGPVPVGYGRLIVGSQTIAASYDIDNIPIAPIGTVSAGDSSVITGKTRIIAYSFGSESAPEGWVAKDTPLSGRGNPVFLAFYVRTGSIDLTGLTNPAPAKIYQQGVRRNQTNWSLLASEGSIIQSIDLGMDYGDEDYTVRLHFSTPRELVATNQIGAFSIYANGQFLETITDITTAAGGQDKGLIKTYNGQLDGLGRVNFTIFENVVGNPPLLNGLELYV